MAGVFEDILQVLHNITSDLDVMLRDLYQKFPYTSSPDHCSMLPSDPMVCGSDSRYRNDDDDEAGTDKKDVLGSAPSRFQRRHSDSSCSSIPSPGGIRIATDHRQGWRVTDDKGGGGGGGGGGPLPLLDHSGEGTFLDEPYDCSPSPEYELESSLSSDGEYYSMEEDQGSTTTDAGSESDSVTGPLSPISPLTPPPPPDHGPLLWAGGGPGEGERAPGPAIPLLERLIRTHAIWYLPNVGCRGATHILRGREQGIFLVHQGAHKDSLVLTVREGSRPALKHYSVESTPRGLSLHGSTNYFQAIPVLIGHYCSNRSDLPCQLALPDVILQAKSHQELTSLALLGQDFWISRVLTNNHRNRQLQRTETQVPVTPYQTSSPRASRARSYSPRGGAPTHSYSEKVTLSTFHPAQTPTSNNATGNNVENGHTNNRGRGRAMGARRSNSDNNFRSNNRSSNLINNNIGNIAGGCDGGVTSGSNLNGHRVLPNGASSGYSHNEEVVVSSSGCSTTTRNVTTYHHSLNRKKMVVTSENILPTPFSLSNHSTSSVFQKPDSGSSSEQAINGSRNSVIYDNLVNGFSTSSFFKPIQNGHISEDCSTPLMSSSPAIGQKKRVVPSFSGGKKGFTANPGFSSEHRNSGSDFIDPEFFMDVKHKSAKEIEHVEEFRTTKTEQIISPGGGKAKDPVVFTFDLIVPQNESSKKSSEDVRKVDPTTKVTGALTVPQGDASSSSAEHSPAYAEPYDSLLINLASYSVERLHNLSKLPQGKVQVPIKQQQAPPPQPPPVLLKPLVTNRTTMASSSRASDKYLKPYVPSHANRPIYREEIVIQAGRSPPVWRSSVEQPVQLADYQTPLDTTVSSDDLSRSRSHSSHLMPGYSPELLRKAPLTTKTVSPPRESTTKSSSFRALQSIITPARTTRAQSLPKVVTDHQGVLSKGGVGLGPVQEQLTPSSTLITRHRSGSVDSLTRRPRPQTPPSVRQLEEDLRPELLRNLDDFNNCRLRKFPVYKSDLSLCSVKNELSENATVEDIISTTSPELTLKPIKPLTARNLQRMSDYDNLQCHQGPISRKSAHSSMGTQYCLPWDSTPWQDLLAKEIEEANTPKFPVPISPTSTISPFSPCSSLASPTFPQSPPTLAIPAPRFSSSTPKTQFSPSFATSHPQSLASPGSTVQSPLSPNLLVQCCTPDPLQKAEDGDEDADDDCSSSDGGDNDHDSLRPPSEAFDSDCAYSTFEYHHKPRGLHKVASVPCRIASERPYQPVTAAVSSSATLLPNLMPFVSNQIGSPTGDSVVMDAEAFATAVENMSEDDIDEVETQFNSLLATPKLMSYASRGQVSSPGLTVRDYVSGMAEEGDTTFGAIVSNFIKCTLEGSETNPHTVVRSVRQFMNGIKNYLVQHGEARLNDIIESERRKLDSTEFLNVDTILESALHKSVIRPLKQHIYTLFVSAYKQCGSLQQMSDNIKLARTQTPYELGVKPGVLPPGGSAVEAVKHFLTQMQKAYSPLKKLENLAGAVNAITAKSRGATSHSETCLLNHLTCDDLLPVLVQQLAQCGMVSAEIEAEYMWGLLHPCLLAGEGGYHLTVFTGAVHILKHLKAMVSHGQPKPWQLHKLPGFLQVIIPEEKNDSMVSRTLPTRAAMNTRHICNLLAHMLSITNPHDYGLYALSAGREEKLSQTVCPHTLRDNQRARGFDCVFVYKRKFAKFAWPNSFHS